MNADTRTAYEKNKPNIYKWRENNKEKYNASSNKAQAIYHVKNKERISQRKKEWYLRKKSPKNSYCKNIWNLPFLGQRGGLPLFGQTPPFLPDFYKPLTLIFYPPLIGTFRILGKKGGGCPKRRRRI